MINIEGEEVPVDTSQNKNRIMCPRSFMRKSLNLGEKLFKLITKVVNQCLRGHPVPEQGKEAYISSIHKSSRKYPGNFGDQYCE